MIGEDRQALDTAEHREGGDASGGGRRPDRAKASLAAGQSCLDAFGDMQAQRHILVGEDFDAHPKHASQHALTEMAAAIVAQGSAMHRNGRHLRIVVMHDRAVPADHGRQEGPFALFAAERAGFMKPDHASGYVIWQIEAAPVEILFDHGSARIDRFGPERSGTLAPARLFNNCVRAIAVDPSNLALLPRHELRQAAQAAHMIAAGLPVVVGEAENRKAAVRPEPDRQRTILAAVAGTGSRNAVAAQFATEPLGILGQGKCVAAGHG